MEWTRTRTRQMIGAQNPTRDTLPDWVPRSWYQGQLFILYYLCHFLYERRLHGARVLNVCWPINRWATTQHYPLNKTENIEDYFRPASAKPDSNRVPITAYVPDIQPDTDLLCSFHPYNWQLSSVKHVQNIIWIFNSFYLNLYFSLQL